MKKYVVLGTVVVVLSLLSLLMVKKSTSETVEQQNVQELKNLTVAKALFKIPHISIFASLVQKADVLPDLETFQHLTILAPLNSAFQELEKILGADAYKMVLNNPSRIFSLVNNHIIPHVKRTHAELSDVSLRASSGMELATQKHNHVIHITQAQGQDDILDIAQMAKIVEPNDIVTQNGIIHTINKIIMD